MGSGSATTCSPCPPSPPPCASVPPPGHVVHRQRARRGRGFNCVCGGCACLLPAVLWPSPQPPCTPSARGMPKEKEAVLRDGGGGGGRGRLCQRRRHQGVVQAVRQRGGIEIVEHVATVVLKISSHFPTVYRLLNVRFIHSLCPTSSMSMASILTLLCSQNSGYRVYLFLINTLNSLVNVDLATETSFLSLCTFLKRRSFAW